MPAFLAHSFLFLALFFTPSAVDAGQAFEYVSPRPGATLVSPATAVALRPGPLLAEYSVRDEGFRIRGMRSGRHNGEVRLALDGRTIIFQPDRPFTPGETVTVDVQSGILTASGMPITGLTYTFTVSPKPLDSASSQPRALPQELLEADFAVPKSAQTALSAAVVERRYQTLPDDFPSITVTVSLDNASDDSIFLGPAPTNWGALILDSRGEPVYYHPRPSTVLDFKKQPNGLLSYFDITLDEFHVLDDTYTLIDTVTAGNGYTIDEHELHIMDNGNYLFMIYDPQPVDMSQIVAGGQPTATVQGLVIQELDIEDNVVFEWRSWDHIPITDTYMNLTAANIDYVHGNSLDVDNDGNILLSSRHLQEITKINRRTGDIIWRWGGKANQFTFINDDRGGFHFQHHARRQENGNITLFDNGTADSDEAQQFSRAVEYKLNERAMTAELVWSYRNTPDIFSRVMGNVQRLPNGHTSIGWGSGWPNTTEVTAAGEKVYELAMDPALRSYRVFRFPWQGFPAHAPTLVANVEDGKPALYYSWNGATEIAAYRIYGGMMEATTLVGEQTKTGFETKTLITDGDAQKYCTWRIMPVDKNGEETMFSNSAFATVGNCTQLYLPIAGN